MIEMSFSKTLIGAEGKMQLKVDTSVEGRTFLALAGESGSGKTTLLRIIAGLESIDKGVLKVDGKVWIDGKKSLPPQKRGIGFVFQDYALFPNMSVEKNLLYVKNDRGFAKRLLELTGLLELKDRYPNTLSGGQKQRVALSRAMMNRPQILLMDEPLSALNPEMRTSLQMDILKLHKEFGTTTIIVSHDPSEIYRLANRVVVLHLGEIINDGSPKDVLLRQSGSQKFSFSGELLEITKVDVLHIAIVAIGQQLVEVVIDKHEAQMLQVGQSVEVSTKAFVPMIKHLSKKKRDL
ncbi:MAG: ABC transporter ATP-binding protein [Campylobacterales bacterium]